MIRNLMFSFLMIGGVLVAATGCQSSGRDATGVCRQPLVTSCGFGQIRECAYNSDGCESCGCVATPAQPSLQRSPPPGFPGSP